MVRAVLLVPPDRQEHPDQLEPVDHREIKGHLDPQEVLVQLELQALLVLLVMQAVPVQ